MVKWLGLLLLIPLLLHAADEDPVWSKPVQGMRARLCFMPVHKPGLDDRYQVYLQFENVGVTGSQGSLPEAKSFQYSESDDVALGVTDANKQKVNVTDPE